MDLSAERIDSAAQEVLADEMYQYADLERIHFRWDWLLEPIRAAWDALTDFLDRIMANAPEGTQTALYIVLSLILLAILAHGLYVIWRAVQPPPRITLEADVKEAAPAGPGEWVERANALADAGNYVDASRSLYEAALMMLEEKRRGHVRRGLTTTEYLRTFQAPWVREHLRTFVDLINWKWYRARSFDADDYAQCRAAYETIAARLREMA